MLLFLKWVTSAWLILSAATSLSWRRAGCLRVASRACCTTPSRNQRAVWRFVLPRAPHAEPSAANKVFKTALSSSRCWGSGRGSVGTRTSPAISPELGALLPLCGHSLEQQECVNFFRLLFDFKDDFHRIYPTVNLFFFNWFVLFLNFGDDIWLVYIQIKDLTWSKKKTFRLII